MSNGTIQDRVRELQRRARERALEGLDTRDRSEPEQLRHEAPEAPRREHLGPMPTGPSGWSADLPEWSGTCPRCGGPGRRSGVCAECAEKIERALLSKEPPAEVVGGSRRKGDGAVTATSVGRVSGGGHRVVDATAARRRHWQQVEKPTEVVDPGSLTLPEVLARAPEGTRRVILTRRPGGEGGAFMAWALDDPPEGWAQDGHYLPASEPERAVLRYSAPWGSVEVHQAGAWFGKDRLAAGAAAITEALAVLGRAIEHEFPGGRLLSTPATTGRDLWHRSIPDQHWPTLPADLQDLIRDTSGQGRIQFFRYHEPELPGLVELDGRVMYAGLTWGLGAGVPEHDTGAEYLGQTRARYRVSFTVPSGWSGPGILGVKDGGSWSYPDTPGETGEGWCDGAELHLAHEHGWRYVIRERLIFPTYSGPGPLDLWTKKLLKVRGSIEAGVAVGSIEPEAGKLAGDGVRSIILHGLGAFVGRRPLVTRSVPVSQPEAVPATAQNLRAEGGRLVWSEPREVRDPGSVHPEYAAAVWARCRARMLSGPTGTRGIRSGALHLPAGVELLAILTDALYLTSDPGWPDDGKPGRLRVKANVAGPLPTPATALAMIETKRAHGG